MEDEEQKHALLSASTAHRWLKCPPSARLEKLEEVSECSVYAEEGTDAHKLAEIYLSWEYGKDTKERFAERWNEFKNESKYYNEEFNEYVLDFVNDVKQITAEISKQGKSYHIYFELRVNYSNFVPQGYGTSDVVIVTEDTIIIIDLKFGQGVPVSAIGNPQLRLYAMGTLNLFPNSKFIKTVINQPRLLHMDSEEMTKEYLLKWCQEEVKPAADLAIEGRGQLNATEDGCRWCKLAGKCAARADLRLAQAQREFEIIDHTEDLAKVITVEQIATILEIAPLFNDWFGDVQKYAYKLAMNGTHIPGFKLVEGRTTRQITDKEVVAKKLIENGYTIEQITKPVELLGISKLEALVGKKKLPELIGDYLIKPRGQPTLVSDEDRRPALANLAELDFAEDYVEIE